MIKKDKHDKLIIEKIPSLPGNKIAIAQSIDKKYFAFSGKIDDEIGYQIYFKKWDNLKEQGFEPISQKTHFPIGLAFSVNNKSLFYADLKEGDSSLKKINLTTEKFITTTIVEHFNVIFKVFTKRNNDFVYFSGRKTALSPSFIYKYNLKTKKIIQLTSTSRADTLDVSGDISPDGSSMLVLQRKKYGENDSVRVINLNNGDTEYQYHHDSTIYDAKWINNDDILFFDKKNIIKINYKKINQSVVSKKPSGLSNISIKDHQHFFSLQSLPSKKLFIEKKLPFNFWSTEHVFNLDKNIYEINEFTNKMFKLILSNKNNNTILAKINIESNETTPLITTEYPIEIISTKKGHILLRLNHRFAIFDVENNQLVYITTSDEFIGDATFAKNAQSVLFSIRDYKGWIIKRYSLQSKKNSLFIRNYRHIRPYNKDFILGDKKGDMYLLRSNTQKLIKLNFKLSNEPDTRWYITEPFIYWSSHDLVNVIFHQLDLSDINHPKGKIKKFDYNKIRADFTVSLDGSKLTYAQRRRENDDIVKVLFNDLL